MLFLFSKIQVTKEPSVAISGEWKFDDVRRVGFGSFGYSWNVG